MPGGRNSGHVYNMYKVKYKKNKKHNAVNTKLPVPPPTTGPPQYNHHKMPLDSPKLESTTSYYNMTEAEHPNKSFYSMAEERTSSQTTTLSTPSSPQQESIPASINILKAVLTGSQQVCL